MAPLHHRAVVDVAPMVDLPICALVTSGKARHRASTSSRVIGAGSSSLITPPDSCHRGASMTVHRAHSGGSGLASLAFPQVTGLRVASSTE